MNKRNMSHYLKIMNSMRKLNKRRNFWNIIYGTTYKCWAASSFYSFKSIYILGLWTVIFPEVSFSSSENTLPLIEKNPTFALSSLILILFSSFRYQTLPRAFTVTVISTFAVTLRAKLWFETDNVRFFIFVVSVGSGTGSQSSAHRNAELCPFGRRRFRRSGLSRYGLRSLQPQRRR